MRPRARCELRAPSTALNTGRNLSADSKRSLELQGGIFTDAEAQRFISQPHAEGAVSVRLWDDAAKIENADTPPLSHYLALAKTIALRR